MCCRFEPFNLLCDSLSSCDRAAAVGSFTWQSCLAVLPDHTVATALNGLGIVSRTGRSKIEGLDDETHKF
jgi:hypothetical protein